MRKWLEGAAASAFGFLCPGAALAGPPPDARQSELLSLLRHDCGSCHGLTMKGGLGPPLLPADLDGKTEQVLVETILDGRPQTPMPPWRSELSETEAAWLVERLRQGLP
jgi:cytochrome c55X